VTTSHLLVLVISSNNFCTKQYERLLIGDNEICFYDLKSA